MSRRPGLSHHIVARRLTTGGWVFRSYWADRGLIYCAPGKQPVDNHPKRRTLISYYADTNVEELLEAFEHFDSFWGWRRVSALELLALEAEDGQ